MARKIEATEADNKNCQKKSVRISSHATYGRSRKMEKVHRKKGKVEKEESEEKMDLI